MKIWHMIVVVLVLIPILLISVLADENSEDGACIHVVDEGENFFRIAYDYGFSKEEFWAANPQIDDPGYIYPQQRLNIPGCVVETAPANISPRAADDSEVTRLDTPLRINVLANDEDPDGTLLEVVEVSQPNYGEVHINDDSTISYNPNSSHIGRDNFTYSIVDARGATHAATVYVTVMDQPTVSRGTLTIDLVSSNSPQDSDSTEQLDETQTYDPTDEFIFNKGDSFILSTADLLKNDGQNSSELWIQTVDVRSAEGGQVSFNGDGSITYLPPRDFIGTDSFTYTFNGPSGKSAPITVSITLVNNAPIARDDGPTIINKNTPTDFHYSEGAGLFLNDMDPDDDEIMIVDVDELSEAQGILDWNEVNQTITYTPPQDHIGPDSFSYEISDGFDGAVAVVRVNVINNPPIPAQDSYSTQKNQPLVISVRNDIDGILDNDDDPDPEDKDQLFLVNMDVFSQEMGTLTNSDDLTTITYTPPDTFSGADTFTYIVSDGLQTAEGTVTIDVMNLNPTANDDDFSVDKNAPLEFFISNGSDGILDNDDDPDGDEVAFGTFLTTDTNGNVEQIGEQRVVYTPNEDFVGTDIFGYRITDGFGGTAEAQIKIFVVNRPPQALPDTAYVDKNQSTTIVVMDNDTDPNQDDDLSVIELVTDPVHGSAYIENNGRDIRYTPDTDYIGSDSMEYRIQDESFATATALVTLEVGNSRPNAVIDEFIVVEATTILPVLDNDIDDDNDLLTIVAISQPSIGSVVLDDETQELIYQLNDPNFSGTVTFDYTVSDGFATDSTRVTLQVDLLAGTGGGT